MPFKLNQNRRHHIPKQKHRVTNWPAYDAALRQRGSLTVWFSDEAIAAWRAEPRTTRGGECQASCRVACVMIFVYAAPPFRVFDWLWTKAAWTTASRSGLSVTAVIGVQFRV